VANSEAADGGGLTEALSPRSDRPYDDPESPPSLDPNIRNNAETQSGAVDGCYFNKLLEQF